MVAWASAGSYRARACYDPIAEHSVYVDRNHRAGDLNRSSLKPLVSFTNIDQQNTPAFEFGSNLIGPSARFTRADA